MDTFENRESLCGRKCCLSVAWDPNADDSPVVLIGHSDEVVISLTVDEAKAFAAWLGKQDLSRAPRAASQGRIG